MHPIFYTDENEYCQLALNNLDAFPREILSHEDSALFCWASEMTVYEDGVGSGMCKIDLALVDEYGAAWIVEAKLHNNTELSGAIWRSQIQPYRAALLSAPWEVVHQRTKSFLCGHYKRKPLHIAPQAQSLLASISDWQTRLKRCVIPPELLVNRIAHSLKTGQFGIMILADVFSKSVVESAGDMRHDGPLAYVVGILDNSEMIYATYWMKKGRADNSLPTDIHVSNAFKATYAEYEKMIRSRKCTLQSIADGLCDESKERLSRFLALLNNLRFPWREGKTYGKGFDIEFNVHGQWISMISIGWPDSVTPQVPKEQMIYGQHSLKLDFNLYRARQMPFMKKDILWPWAQELSALGWIGKGTGKMMGVGDVSDAEFTNWGKRMYYFLAPYQNFFGREQEIMALAGFIPTISKFLAQIENAEWNAEGQPVFSV